MTYIILTSIFVLSIGMAIYLSVISKRVEEDEKENATDKENQELFETESMNFDEELEKVDVEDNDDFEEKIIEENIEEEII